MLWKFKRKEEEFIDEDDEFFLEDDEGDEEEGKGRSFSDLLFGLAGPGKVNLVGIDIGETTVKLAEVGFKNGRYILERYGIELLDINTFRDNVVVDEDSLARSVKVVRTKSRSSKKDVALCVPAPLVISKTIQAPANLSPKELEDHVLTEVSQFTHSSVAEMLVDWVVVGRSKRDDFMNDVVVFASKSEHVDTRSDSLLSLGLNTLVVEIDAYTIGNTLEALGVIAKDSDEVTMMLDIGSVSTSVFVYMGSSLVYTQSLGFGTRRFVSDLNDSLGVSVDEAQELFRHQEVNITEEVAEQIQDFSRGLERQLRQTCVSLSSSTDIDDIDRVLIAGGGASVVDIDKVVSETVNSKAEVLDISKYMDFGKDVNVANIDTDGRSLLTAVGLAMRGHLS